VINETRKRGALPSRAKRPVGVRMHTGDPTESYAQDDTPLLRACYEMTRFAHVSANDPREDILRNLTLQAVCCEMPRSKRFVARKADRIRWPGRTSTEARATPALSPTPRWIRIAAPLCIMPRDPQETVVDLLMSVCYHSTMDKGDQRAGRWNGGSTRFAGSSAGGRLATSSAITR
jgi:hypothetical protein